MVTVIGTLFCVVASPAYAQKAKSKEEIEAKIRELDKKKQLEQSNRMKASDANRPTGQDLDVIIAKYERLLDGCAIRRSDKCANAMYTLGQLYEDRAYDRFNNKKKEYERTRREPPVFDFSEANKTFWRLSREYPDFPDLPNALYLMSQNYLEVGHLDTTRILLEQIVNSFPSSQRFSAAHVRLGELAFMDNNFNKAYEYFKLVKRNQVDPKVWEMVQSRLAEIEKSRK